MGSDEGSSVFRSDKNMSHQGHVIPENEYEDEEEKRTRSKGSRKPTSREGSRVVSSGQGSFRHRDPQIQSEHTERSNVRSSQEKQSSNRSRVDASLYINDLQKRDVNSRKASKRETHISVPGTAPYQNMPVTAGSTNFGRDSVQMPLSQ